MDDIKNAFETCGIEVNPLMFQGGSSDLGGVIFLQKSKENRNLKNHSIN